MKPERIPASFISYASDILGETENGLNGNDIVKASNAYALEYDVDVPHSVYPFDAPNKRTALCKNLMVFSSKQQFRIIKELCDHNTFSIRENKQLPNLRTQLFTQYSHLDEDLDASSIDNGLIEQTRHWLDAYPESLKLYEEAITKFKHGVFIRNALDDIRLSLEKLLQQVFSNEKSLENQISQLGAFIKDHGGSKEFANMFEKLVDYYAKHNNRYVKHDDAIDSIIEEEIEFVIEVSSSFMKHLVKLNS